MTADKDARIAALEAQLAEAKAENERLKIGIEKAEEVANKLLSDCETQLWHRFKEMISAIEATPPAPKVTEEMDQLVKGAVAKYEAMTPEDKAAHDKAQRESFLRGLEPCEHGNRNWETCPQCRAALTAAQEEGR